MALSLSSLFAASPEQTFWRWFTKNEPRLYHFENEQERIFDELSREIRKVDRSLTFEFGPETNGKREFVISADGIREAFSKVESLYQSAPKLEHWVFLKFRPRRVPMDLKLQDITVKAADVRVLISRGAERKIALLVLFPEFEPPKERFYTHAAFLFLDQALGEYDVETKVGYVGAGSTNQKDTASSVSLSELGQAFDQQYQTTRLGN